MSDETKNDFPAETEELSDLMLEAASDLKEFFEKQNLQMGEVLIQSTNTGWIVRHR